MTPDYPEQPILMVDDEDVWLQTMALILKYELDINNVRQAYNGNDALSLLKVEPFSLLLLDLNMPKMNGKELLQAVTETYPELPVLIISGMDQLETAVECMRLGAFDYFVKSTEKERLFVSIKRALTMRELQRECRSLKEHLLSRPLQKPEVFAAILSEDEHMQDLFGYLEAVSGSSEPLLITGESGTGKELLALAAHELSRADNPWVAINVAGLDDTAFSDTLFGHIKGAYTGAERQREGLLAQAGSGTLFLDEIGDLSASLQVKLLRVLQEGVYYPLGSDQPRISKARIVVATNQNLDSKVESGHFRKDLYYRLCTHHVQLPPLRERSGDIPLLLDHFLSEASTTLDRSKPAVAVDLFDYLCSYHFPGNVRQLRGMVFDALSRHQRGQLSIEEFKQAMPPGDRFDQPISDVSPFAWRFPLHLPTLAEMGEILSDEALRRSGGNQSSAGRMLGISQQALNQRLKKRL